MSDVDVRWRGEKVIEDKSHRLVTDTQIDYWNKKSDPNHKHTKSDIADFPASMPASDVPAWAKATNKPTYTWAEITGKPDGYTPSKHLHTKSEISDFPDAIKNPSTITIMMNGGTTEDKTCFTYDGSKVKNVNITPTSIGAALQDHNHDTRYYTRQDIDNKLADSSEGIFSNMTWEAIKNKPDTFTPTNHTHTKIEITDFPNTMKNPNNIVIKLNSGTTEAKDQFTYDGSSMKIVDITPSTIGASTIGHVHTKSDIKDFPTSMPASDVYAWAKEKNKPSYSWSEISGKPGEYAPGSHTHKKSDITDFPESLKNPLELTIHLNGGTEEDVTHFIYDGSKKKAINITPANIGASPVGHTHDDRYYTEYEIDTKLKNISDTLSAHNHVKLQGVASTTAVPGKSEDGFLTYHYNVNNGLANNMPSTNNANAILTISRHGGDYTTQLGFSSNDNIYYRNGVGSTAWKRLLDSANFNDYAPTKTGGGASGSWDISISGKANTAGTADKANAVDWGNVNGKPYTYPSSSHTHTKSDITDFPDSLKNPNDIIIRLNGGTTEGANQFTYNGSVAKTINITPAEIGAATSGHNHDSEYSKLGHNHDERYYTETEIDTKLDNINSTLGSHTHDDRYYTESEIDTKIGGKADSIHTHAVADITDFPDSLKNPKTLTISVSGSNNHTYKYDGSEEFALSVAASSHNHSKSEIIDFPSSLKNPKSLTINLKGAANYSYTYDGSDASTINITAAEIGASAVGHTHNISSIINLQTTLDLKANKIHKHSANDINVDIFGMDDTISLGEYLKCDAENGFFYFKNRIGTSSFVDNTSGTYSADIILDATASRDPHIEVIRYYGDNTSRTITYNFPSQSGTLALLSDINNTTYPINYVTLDANFATQFRSQTKGNTAAGDYISTIRCDTASVSGAPQYGSGLAWGRSDTHGYIYVNYATGDAYIGGGNANQLNWIKGISFTDHTHSYLPLSGGTLSGSNQTPLVINGVANGEASISYQYNGDGNTAWVVGPGAGSADMTYWGFYRAGVGRVTCISSNGNIDTNGYLQSNGLINTYSEYQSCKGTGYTDWRFGSGTGTGDNSWFGIYNYSTGITSLMTHTSGILRIPGEYQTTNASGLRIVYGVRGFILQSDGSSITFNGTNYGDQWGSAITSKNAGMNLETGQWWFRDDCNRGGYPVLTSTAATYRIVYFQKTGSQIRVDDTSGNAYYAALATSDIRLKKNISNTEVDNALDIINKIELHSFDWKEDSRHQKIGFIADELEELDDNLSHGGGETEEGGLNTKMVDSFYLQGYEVKAIQELSLENKQLREIVSQLKDEIAEIKKALK
ncbi:MAG TPA: hypothetical protein DCW90_20520 [Lachnospiraceae bacterium]|nr:hypothetical protein [Lachnospiraceae bacterium]